MVGNKFSKEQAVKWLKLTKVPKLGPSRIMKLFTFYDSVDAVFSLSDSELLRTRIFNDVMVSEFNKLKQVSDDNFFRVIEECEQNNISLLPIVYPRYPRNLKNVPYPPLTLFLHGNTELLYERKIAIVGSRKADGKAKKWTHDLAESFVKKHYVVISGGAVGIDYSAHKGALDADGKTICVLGSGFFKMFPESHADLFNEIKDKGLLVSEHLPNFPGSKIALVQRNRITSGLSNALVMAASGLMGGAMIQTKIAFEQRIPIFCPNRSLNLQPNEGLSQVINDWKGIEFETSDQLIERLSTLENYSQKQSKLV